MNCPVCQVTLVMADKSGVEIDYCPKCRGVWLDRGELDKIIERAAAVMSGPVRGMTDASSYEHHEQRRSGGFDDDDHYGRYPRKKKSFLGEIFDFD